MDTSNYGKGNNNPDTVMEAAESRGMKRSSSHLDLDELPEDSKENEFQERRAKKQMQQYETLALLKRAMRRASIHFKNRHNSDIERNAELTRVERESLRESTTSVSSTNGGLEDTEADTCTSDNEDVFESP